MVTLLASRHCKGPCPLNQRALATSRLWDAIVGFFGIFSAAIDRFQGMGSLGSQRLDFVGLQDAVVSLLQGMLEGRRNASSAHVAGSAVVALEGDAVVAADPTDVVAAMTAALVECFDDVASLLARCEAHIRLHSVLQSSLETSIGLGLTIKERDFAAAMRRIHGLTDAEAHALWSRLDVDGDGHVDVQELGRLYQEQAGARRRCSG